MMDGSASDFYNSCIQDGTDAAWRRSGNAAGRQPHMVIALKNTPRGRTHLDQRQQGTQKCIYPLPYQAGLWLAWGVYEGRWHQQRHSSSQSQEETRPTVGPGIETHASHTQRQKPLKTHSARGPSTGESYSKQNDSGRTLREKFWKYHFRLLSQQRSVRKRKGQLLFNWVYMIKKLPLGAIRLYCEQIITFTTIFEQFSLFCITALADTLDKLVHRTHEQDSVHRDSKQELPALARNRNLFSCKEVEHVNLRQRMEKARQVQTLYPSLRKHLITFQDRQEQTGGIGSTFKVDSSNCTFAGIVQGIRKAKIEEITRIRVVGALQDDLLCFLLDFFAGIRSGGVCELILDGVRVGGKEKVVGKLKQFIQKTSVCRLAFHGASLSSKDFCVLCLGIGAKMSFDHFSLRNNDIGELAVRCLDVLMKFHKSLKFDFSGNPLERELKGRPGYKRCLVSSPLQ